VLAAALEANLWGSEIRFGVACGQLGGDVILLGESPEDLLPADPVLGEVDRLQRLAVGLSWCEMADKAMHMGAETLSPYATW